MAETSKNSVKNLKKSNGIAFSSINDFMKLACYIIMDRIKSNNRKKARKKAIFSVSVLKFRKKSVTVRFRFCQFTKIRFRLDKKRLVNRVFGSGFG